MQALGMVETMGLLGSVEAADVMMKAANVTLLGKHYSRGGIVTIEITGDVGAVKAAVEAAEMATKKLKVYLASHVIPRPNVEVADILIENTKKLEKEIIEDKIETKKKVEAVKK